MDDSADQDLRDVFKVLYSDDDWLSDDEETISAVPEKDVEPEVDDIAIESDTEDPTQLLTRRYSRKRFMDGLDGLLKPNAKRQRIYNSPSTSSSTITCNSPFPTLPSPSLYAPFSPLPLLARLRTFDPASYSTLIPSSLGPVQAALHGWMNEGRNTLSCGVCSAKWSLGDVEDIRESKLREEVARRLVPGLLGRHKRSCSWRVRISPEILYSQLRRYLHPPVTANISMLAFALEKECIIRSKSEFRWTTPLSTRQIEHLQIRLTPRIPNSSEANEAPSPFASALALFCWFPFHPNGTSHTLSTDINARTDIVQCRLCDRRVGLWNFRAASKEERKFDLVGEHLEWCPIRDEAASRKWWEDIPLLNERQQVSGRVEISISNRMEVRPWRRKLL